MTKRKVEDDSEDVASEDEDEAPKKSAKPKAKAAPRKKKDAAVPAPSVTEDGWHIVPPGFMFKQFGPSVPSAKIAAVDLDGTMITQKSTLKFGPKDADDWKWFNKKKTPEALRGFVEDGYRLVMITNQGSIKAKFDGPAADKVRGRISNVIAETSFFVGDAAGRPGDFAASDKDMAAALGIQFKVPEDVFGEMDGMRPLCIMTTLISML
ncbi:MAG: hypothetical protein WDW38_008122 [Sanguina aurantia]